MASRQDILKEALEHNGHALCIGCDVLRDGDSGFICNKGMMPIPEKEKDCPVIVEMIKEAGLEQCSFCECLDADRCGDVFYPVCEVRTCKDYEKIEKISEKQAELIK